LSVPVIVTLVAFVAETVSVDELPALIEVGLATRVAVAAGGGGVAAATVTIAVAVALPPVRMPWPCMWWWPKESSTLFHLLPPWDSYCRRNL